MLTDIEASAAQAGDRDYKLADANGLYLFVTRSGFKSWRLKYRFGGKEKRLTFGSYPEVSLEDARARRDDARALLRDNVDPALEKQRFRPAGAGDEPLPFAVEEQLPLVTPPVPPVQAPPIGRVAPPPAPEVDRLLVTPLPVVPAAVVLPIVPPAWPPKAPAAMTPPPPPPAATLPPLAPPTAAPQTSPSPAAALLAQTAPAPEPAPQAAPAEPAPVSVEEAPGSRALSLLKQAETAAETAASQSRTAKRFTLAVLALFGVLAVALGAWLLSSQRRVAGAAAGAGAVPVAASVLTPAPGGAAPGGPGVMPHAGAATSATPASAVGGAGAGSSPVAPAAGPPPAPNVAASNAGATHGGAAPVVRHQDHRADAPKATPHRHRHKHRHKRRNKHRLRHNRAHRVVIAVPRSPAASRHHAVAARAHTPAQETYHAVQAAAPRGAAIDPALDRAGRAALCMRAAYSASAGCAAVR